MTPTGPHHVRRLIPTVTLCLLLVAAVLLAGCGSPAPAPEPPPAPAPAPALKPAAPAPDPVETVPHVLLATGEPGVNAYPLDAPGTSELLPREYLDAPPLVPHDVTEFEITKEANACLSCHETGVSLSDGHVATKIPRSHYTDIPTGIVSDTLHNLRYNCRICHLPQSTEAPLRQ